MNRKLEMAERLLGNLVQQHDLTVNVLNVCHSLIAEGEPEGEGRSITYPIYELEQETKRLAEKIRSLKADVCSALNTGKRP